MKEPKTLREFLEVCELDVQLKEVPKRTDYFAKVWEDHQRIRTHYEYVIYNGGRTHVGFFSAGSLCGEMTKIDILGSLLMDSSCYQYSFEDYCDNLGYEKDSRKDFADYQEGKKLIESFILCVGEDFIEKTLDLENDL